MVYTRQDLLEYIRDNEIQFVKLAFCDLLGRQRNISVLSSQLEDAFENGVAIDSSAVTGVGGIDLNIMPVSALLSDLPWRPHSGRVVSVFCKIADMYRKPYECDPMVLLERQVETLKKLGYTAQVATECEFYVFKDELENTSELEPLDNADYCSCAPFDKCENLRRDVILSLEDMGLKPISSHHERGPGQNEVDFEAADPLSAARNFVMFKSAIKNVCAINGTVASFMPRPLSDRPGSGLHLSITLSGKNKKAATEAFAEGVLRRYREITCLSNPTLNSYKRLGRGYKIGWAANRKTAIRIFDDDSIQLRTTDSTGNIFAVLALVFAAGCEGIKNGYKLREPGGSDTDRLFESIFDAIEYAQSSKWLHEQIPDQLDNVLTAMKNRETNAAQLKTDRELFDFYEDI